MFDSIKLLSRLLQQVDRFMIIAPTAVIVAPRSRLYRVFNPYLAGQAYFRIVLARYLLFHIRLRLESYFDSNVEMINLRFPLACSLYFSLDNETRREKY